MEARNISTEEAAPALDALVGEGLILLEPETVPGKVNLDGWNPSTGAREDGNVAGVVVRYWPTATQGDGESHPRRRGTGSTRSS